MPKKTAPKKIEVVMPSTKAVSTAQKSTKHERLMVLICEYGAVKRLVSQSMGMQEAIGSLATCIRHLQDQWPSKDLGDGGSYGGRFSIEVLAANFVAETAGLRELTFKHDGYFDFMRGKQRGPWVFGGNTDTRGIIYIDLDAKKFACYMNTRNTKPKVTARGEPFSMPNHYDGAKELVKMGYRYEGMFAGEYATEEAEVLDDEPTEQTPPPAPKVEIKVATPEITPPTGKKKKKDDGPQLRVPGL